MGVAAAAVRAQVAAQQGGRNTSPPFAVRSSGEMAPTLPLVTAANSLDKRNRTRQMDDLDGQLFVLCVFGHAEGENLWHTLRCFEDGAESVCKYKIPRYPAAALLSLSLSLSLSVSALRVRCVPWPWPSWPSSSPSWSFSPASCVSGPPTIGRIGTLGGGGGDVIWARRSMETRGDLSHCCRKKDPVAVLLQKISGPHPYSRRRSPPCSPSASTLGWRG
jgi:hypothetical protein